MLSLICMHACTHAGTALCAFRYQLGLVALDLFVLLLNLVVEFDHALSQLWNTNTNSYSSSKHFYNVPPL